MFFMEQYGLEADLHQMLWITVALVIIATMSFIAGMWSHVARRQTLRWTFWTVGIAFGCFVMLAVVALSILMCTHLAEDTSPDSLRRIFAVSYVLTIVSTKLPLFKLLRDLCCPWVLLGGIGSILLSGLVFLLFTTSTCAGNIFINMHEECSLQTSYQATTVVFVALNAIFSCFLVCAITYRTAHKFSHLSNTGIALAITLFCLGVIAALAPIGQMVVRLKIGIPQGPLDMLRVARWVVIEAGLDVSLVSLSVLLLPVLCASQRVGNVSWCKIKFNSTDVSSLDFVDPGQLLLRDQIADPGQLLLKDHIADPGHLLIDGRIEDPGNLLRQRVVEKQRWIFEEHEDSHSQHEVAIAKPEPAYLV